MQSGQPDRFIGWEEAHKRVIEKREEETGYSSEIEENKQAEMNNGKGKNRGKSAQGKNGYGYGKTEYKGKPSKSPYDAENELLRTPKCW